MPANKKQTEMTQEQLLKLISSGFESINKNLFNMGIEIAAVKGIKQVQQQDNLTTPIDEGDFLFLGNCVGFSKDEKVGKAFLGELQILMKKYQIFDVKVVLTKKF